MDDEGFISGQYGNSSVFDNSKDSDIILKCGAKRFYAHRAILRLWSPFFARSLNSGFPVAESAVFEIDVDDHAAHKPFCALLKHMYGMPFGEHPANESQQCEKSQSGLEHCIRVYMAADKYDIPSARLAAVNSAQDYLAVSDFPEEYPHVPEEIAKICGPGAPQLADGAMRKSLFEWVRDKFDLISQDPNFAEKIKDGSLLDAELNTKLLFELGAKLRRQKTMGR
ncbi:hypothetical protein QM012_000967 [Aureobasidium pullulans]|uniref:BTB domain-containing protein n=1 Tax=Aureobasidium pullulans TaxID=5580 RepID=A0ABR0TFB0_AURPU